MQRRRLFVALALAIGTLLIGRTASAQPAPRFQVGAQFATLHFSGFDSTDFGIAADLSYDLTRYVTLEGEIALFPNGRRVFTDPIRFNSRRLGGLLGVRAGIRRDRFGIFGKVRPGFLHQTYGVVDENSAYWRYPETTVDTTTEFVVDVGGAIEVYQSRRRVLRVDIGDTIIRFSPRLTTHNLQVNVGVGFRF